MKKEIYTYPRSGFLSVEKDLGLIVSMMLKNDRLKNLLFYTSKDCLLKPKLTDKENLELFGKNIKIVPKLVVDGTVENYIIINFDNFTMNATNPEFRDNVIEFDIICHFDQWHLKDFELRPYKIAAEIDSMFNDKHLTGIGTLQFMGANQLIINEEFAGFSLMYQAIHGEEDKKNLSNPIENDKFIEEFDKLWNDK